MNRIEPSETSSFNLETVAPEQGLWRVYTRPVEAIRLERSGNPTKSNGSNLRCHPAIPIRIRDSSQAWQLSLNLLCPPSQIVSLFSLIVDIRLNSIFFFSIFVFTCDPIQTFANTPQLLVHPRPTPIELTHSDQTPQ